MNRPSAGAVLLAALLGGCHAETPHASAKPQTPPAEQTVDRIDTLLADSAGVVVRLQRLDSTTHLLIGVRKADSVHYIYRTLGDLRSTLPQVAFLRGGPGLPLVFWSMGFEELVGAAVIRIDGDSAATIYHAFAGHHGVCGEPTLRTIDGETLIVEPREGVFPDSTCADEESECPSAFPSTWPVLLGVQGNSLVDRSSAHPRFYAALSDTLSKWAEAISRGARIEGLQEPITDLCGAWVPDSLRRLAVRAKRIAG